MSSLDSPAFTNLARKPLSVVAALVVGFVVAGLAPGAVAAAQQDGEPARLAAVYFRLEDGVDAGSGPLSAIGDSRPASYRSFSVIDDGETRRVAPVPGAIAIRMAGADAAVVAAQVGSERRQQEDPDYGNAVADALAAPRVDRFVRTAESGGGAAPTIDLSFDEPLQVTDYLLIQESGGDAVVTVTAVDDAGVLLGAAVEVAGPYQWDTGRSDIDGTPLWVSVVPVPPTLDGSPTPGIRVEARHAQVKVIPLTELVESETPQPAAAQEPAQAAAVQESTVNQTGLGVVASQSAPPTAPAVAENTTVAVSSAAATVASAPSGGPVGAQSTTPAVDESQSPTALAMTGPATDPWLMTVVAMGLIFFGWTIVLAIRNRDGDQGRGHEQLDALGFD